VAVSQSGESAEVVRLAQEVRDREAGSRPFLAAVTNGTQNSLATRADLALDTGAGSESGPSTLTFAASLVTLSAVTRVVGREDGGSAVDLTIIAAEDAARAAGRLLADPEAQAEAILAWHGGRTITLILGRGPARASSEMGALLLKEAAGMPAEALETAQFRHGPLELAGPDLAAVVVATEPETLALDLGLAADLHQAGAAVLVVSFVETPAGLFGVRIDGVDRTLAPAVSVVPVQLLAWRLAVERGRAPGELTRAAKVTTHE
jgi:glucosamine--fructose-6-phosphate aminotransferase (isomerizing)